MGWVDSGRGEPQPGMRPVLFLVANVPLSDDTTGCVRTNRNLSEASENGPVFVLTWLGRVEGESENRFKFFF